MSVNELVNVRYGDILNNPQDNFLFRTIMDNFPQIGWYTEDDYHQAEDWDSIPVVLPQGIANHLELIKTGGFIDPEWMTELFNGSYHEIIAYLMEYEIEKNDFDFVYTWVNYFYSFVKALINKLMPEEEIQNLLDREANNFMTRLAKKGKEEPNITEIKQEFKRDLDSGHRRGLVSIYYGMIQKTIDVINWKHPEWADKILPLVYDNPDLCARLLPQIKEPSTLEMLLNYPYNKGIRKVASQKIEFENAIKTLNYEDKCWIEHLSQLEIIRSGGRAIGYTTEEFDASDKEVFFRTFTCSSPSFEGNWELKVPDVLLGKENCKRAVAYYTYQALVNGSAKINPMFIPPMLPPLEEVRHQHR